MKKSTGAKRLFIDFFFQRILGAFARNARTNDDAPLSSLKRLLGRCYFGLEFVTSFQLFFRKVCIMDVASLLFREFDQIYTPLSKGCFVFLGLVESKTTSFPGLFSAEERMGGKRPWHRPIT